MKMYETRWKEFKVTARIPDSTFKLKRKFVTVRKTTIVSERPVLLCTQVNRIEYDEYGRKQMDNRHIEFP